MTMRERTLAIVRGEPVDRVPFVMYDGMLPVDEVFQVLGEERIGLMRWCGVHRIEYPNCRTESEDFTRDGSPWRRNTIHTPKGSIFEERAFEPVYNSSSVRKHYVEEESDYDVFWSYLDDGVILPDYDRFHRDAKDLGDRGVPLVAMERTPYQQLWVQWVGLNLLGYHFVDFPDRLEQTIQRLTARARRIFEIAAASPADFIDFPDNITAAAIGPERFRKYCVKYYDELAGMLEESGRPVFVHMDGDLKPLWNDIGSSRVEGLDSFSPAPDNDTTVADAVRLWPDKRLFVNFPSSVHLRSREAVMAETAGIMATAAPGGRLQIQLSENVPLKVWRTSLPAIADAIDEYYR